MDGQGNRPDGTMWMVAVAPFGNIVAMNEVSQSELLVFLIFTFFKKFQRQALAHARRTVDLDMVVRRVLSPEEVRNHSNFCRFF